MTTRATTPPKPEQVSEYPCHPEYLPDLEMMSGKYRMRFARSLDELDRILRLRFTVFNVEMGEGLESSLETGRDEDDYDPFCHHLLVERMDSAEIVGTYRLQTFEMAQSGRGFYSAGEFDLEPLGEDFLRDAVELGRACISSEHRNGRVLYLLWKGLAGYVMASRKRYFFGCCSLTSQDPVEAGRVLNHLKANGYLDESRPVRPRPDYACCDTFPAPGGAGTVTLPRLMRLYLEYGARIAGWPAMDRQFKTIDYLAVFDRTAIDGRVREMLFQQT